MYLLTPAITVAQYIIALTAILNNSGADWQIVKVNDNWYTGKAIINGREYISAARGEDNAIFRLAKQMPNYQPVKGWTQA